MPVLSCSLTVLSLILPVLTLLAVLFTNSTKGKKVVSSLDFQEEVDAGAEQVNTASVEQISTAEGVNIGSIKLSTGDEQLSTGQREGKAPMISEEIPKKSKEQVLQEEAINAASADQVNAASADQVNAASAEQVSTAEGVNTGSIKLSTGDEKLSTGDEQVSTAEGVNTGSIKLSTGDEQLST
ncbi:hypothetical protein Tco_1581258, partial [Tanacetum coccineum]